MKKEISVLEFFKIFKKRIGLIISFCVIGLLVFAFLTFYVVTPKFKSTTQLLVSHSRTELVSSTIDIGTNLQLIDTYKDVIKGPVILEDVIDSLDLNITVEELSKRVEVLSQDNSQVFSVEVSDENPQQAAMLANTIADTFYSNIWDIMSIDNVTIISRANPNLVPTSPNVSLNMAIGFVLSLMLGVGISVLLEWMDNTLKDEDFIAKELGWSTLGEISEYSDKSEKESIDNKTTENLQQTSSVKNRI